MNENMQSGYGYTPPAQPRAESPVTPTPAESVVEPATVPVEPETASVEQPATEWSASQGDQPPMQDVPPQNPYNPQGQPSGSVHYTQQGYPGYQPPKNASQGNGMAIAALICGIVAVVTSCCCIGFVPAILAIVFGILALVKKTEKKTMGVVGLVLGGLAVVVSALMLILSFLFGRVVVNDSFYGPYYDEYYDGSYDYFYDDFM